MSGRTERELAKANRRDLAAIVAGGRSVPRRRCPPRSGSPEHLGWNLGSWRPAAWGACIARASATFDISTDLDELARADGALVVCSGFKSILDVAATLEALETRGVLVVGYGTDELPGFFTQSSGLPLEHRVDTPAEAAAIVRAHRAIGLPGAIVLAQPVPLAQSLDGELLRTTLDRGARRSVGQADHGQGADAVLCSSRSGRRPRVAVSRPIARCWSPTPGWRPRLPTGRSVG